MKRDVLSYGVILVGSIFFMFMTTNIAVTPASLASSAFFPRILLGVLICLSAYGLFKAWKAPDRGQVQKMQRPLAIMLGLCIGFVVLLHLVGFVAATTAFIFVSSLYMSGDASPKKLALSACVAFAIAWGINYIFIEILMFILP